MTHGLNDRAISDHETEVVVVGLGPVGSLLTALLARNGVRVSAFDREVDVFPLPRAAHIDHMGLRALQELNVLDDLLPQMIPNSGIEFRSAGGLTLFRIPADRGSISGLPASMYFSQPELDRSLRRAAQESALAHVFSATEVTAIDTSSSGVRVHASHADGRQMEISGRFIVGCDGAASNVRIWAGLETEDLGFEEEWGVVDVKLNQPAPQLPDHMVILCDPKRPLGTGPLPGGRQRFEFMLLADDDRAQMTDPLAVMHILADWLPATGVEFQRAAVYTFRGRVAKRWRAGPVLLAGDAAHLMPPFLGQGMCSGLRDAANLAWKLGLVVNGLSSETILDSYEFERAPHVRAVIDASIQLGRLTCELDPDRAAERDRLLTADPVAASRSFSFRLPDLEPGPLVLDGGGGLFFQPVDAEGNGFDDLVGSRFLVLTRSGLLPSPEGDWWADQLGAVVLTAADVPELEEQFTAWLDSHDADVVIVRPDHFVLGAGRDFQKLTEAFAAQLEASRP